MGKTSVYILLVSMLCLSSLTAQRYLGHRATDSGGELMPEQAAYDVGFYDINLRINPDKKHISGYTIVASKIVIPVEWFVVDLDHRMTVSEVMEIRSGGNRKLRFERRGERVWIHLIQSRYPGEQLRVRIHYAGHPLEAPAPPWVGGFTWARTEAGEHWIATSQQFDGADLWIPCKDHPSDEPDSVAININIPNKLYLASNGHLRGIENAANGTRTFHWFHSNPINNYNIALNIAPYKIIEGSYKSVGGETMPIYFYALPEHEEDARRVFKQVIEHMAFFEKHLGPYPFRNDKYSVAETPHLGMEHQTVIAYGRYRDNQWGYDELHHHELGHEWWGNLVTALDWRDFWIHEGFCAYMQALYNEELHGIKAYHEFLDRSRSLARNITTLAPRESRTVGEVYFVAPEYIESDGDIYTKGAIVLSSLRYVMGEKPFRKLLREFAYPDKSLEKVTNGQQCRFATTDDFLFMAETISGMDLDWFFEVYVRQPVLPTLKVGSENNVLTLEWQAPQGLPFDMPVEVRIGDTTTRIEMTSGRASFQTGNVAIAEIDPDNWIYKRIDDQRR